MRTPDGDDEKGRSFQVTASFNIAEGQHDNARLQQENQNAKDRHDARMFWANAIVAFTAIAGLVFTGVSLLLTRETFRTGHRAWVLVEEMPQAGQQGQIGNVVKESGGNITLKVRNFGDGPAKHVQMAARITCLPDDAPCPDPGQIIFSPGSVMVLGPNHGMAADVPFVWKDIAASEEAQAVMNVIKVDCLYEDVVPSKPHKPATHALYAHTRVTYVDQFGRAHWTHACAKWNRHYLAWDAAANGNDFD